MTGNPSSDRGLALCQGKESLTADRAQQILRRQTRSREKRRSAYKCPICRSWHIGTPPPKPCR